MDDIVKFGVIQEEGADDEKASPQPNPLAHTSMLAGHISQKWERHRLARTKLDDRLLSCLRRRKGVYSDQELTEIRSQPGLSLIHI